MPSVSDPLSTNALVTANVFRVTDPLSAAAEPNRRRILQLLASRPRTVSEVAAEFPVTRSAISQHLLVLADAGLVEAEKVGRQRIYRVLPSGLRKLQAEIDRFWTNELDQLVADAHTLRRELMSYTKTALLPVTPDEAFALITEPERLRRWQTVSAVVDLRAGGSYRWTVTPGHVAAGTFREVEPGRRIVFGWGWDGNPDLPFDASTVTITVEPADGGSLVTLVHEGLNEEQAEAHARGLGPLLRAPRAPRRHRRRRARRVGLRAGEPHARRGGRGGPRGHPAGPAQPHRRRPAQADAVRGLHLPRARRAPPDLARPARRHGRRRRHRPRRRARWRTGSR